MTKIQLKNVENGTVFYKGLLGIPYIALSEWEGDKMEFRVCVFQRNYTLTRIDENDFVYIK